MIRRFGAVVVAIVLIVFFVADGFASVKELPDDLRTFWEARLTELSAVNPSYETTKPVIADGIKTYEVKFMSYGNVPVHGVVAMPAKAKGKLPAILLLHGYGDYGRPEWAKRFAKKGFLALAIDVRGHGQLAKEYNPEATDLIIKGIEKPETYFLVGVLLDAIRGIDYLKTLPEAGSIYLNGTSMGGGTSMMLSVLDERMTAIAAGVPFLNDVPLGIEKADGGPYPIVREFRSKLSKAGKAADVAAADKTLTYIDVMRYAPYMKKPVLIGIGGADTICPEEGIQNTIKKIPDSTKKKVFRNAKAGHVVLPGWHDEVERWFKSNP
ncbi:MAG: acetylxylan esterase [Deltaproteobacteria bacterium]|nr:acetylxylan esterase [Deltaproteobacteria bacterium]